MRYIVELKAKKLSNGATETFYYSGSDMTNHPTGAPPNALIKARIAKPIKARFDLFDRLTTYGAVNSGLGQIELNNADGALDFLALDYTVNGQDVVVWVGQDAARVFPDEFQIVQKCRAVLATATEDYLTISIADELKQLDKPLLTNKYLGNNVLPAGTEGLPEDLKYRRKPRAYGRLQNIAPYYVNTSRLIYQISDNPCSVTAVYSRGVPWASDGSYANFADLQNDALEPANSKYKVYSGAEGTFIRLGSIPFGTLTCDAETAEKRCGELLKTIAIDAGIAGGNISSGDIAALNAIGYQCGAWITEETTSLDAMNQIASAMGVYFRFDNFGVMRLGRLTVPSGTPDHVVPSYKIKRIALISTADTDKGVPAWAVDVLYSRNYTVQTDLGDTAAQSRAAFASEEYRKARKEDAARKALYADSPEIKIETALLNEADAIAESERYLSLLGNRQLFEITVGVDSISDVFPFEVSDTVQINYPRYGLDSANLFVIIGIVYDLGINEITLRVWK